MRAGRDAPMAKALLIPEAWAAARHHAARPIATSIAYCNAVMEPWDGPAAHLRHRRPLGDRRHGPQRPAPAALHHHRRRPADRRLGGRHVRRRRERASSKRAASAPGQMIAVDLASRQILPRRRDHGHAGRQASPTATGSRTSPTSTASCATRRAEPRRFEREELRRRQLAAGFTLEDLELILAPDGGGRQGSHRLHGRRHAAGRAVGALRGLHHFFRQNFSQVTNPPIDSCAKPG